MGHLVGVSGVGANPLREDGSQRAQICVETGTAADYEIRARRAFGIVATLTTDQDRRRLPSGKPIGIRAANEDRGSATCVYVIAAIAAKHQRRSRHIGRDIDAIVAALRVDFDSAYLV